jgi:acetyl/propionyl-CoA carboxylase alpha subunit
MERALAEFQLEGFATNRDLHRLLFAHPQFRAADLSTRFLEECGMQDVLVRAGRVRAAAVAAALESMPGGLAMQHARRATPATVAPGGRRDWEAA